MSTAERNLQVLHGANAAQGSLINFEREQIDTIKRTVAKGVTDAELSMFLTLCGRYQLDPFLKEIWCYKRQKKGPNGQYQDDPNAPAIIMTSRDGYLKVAQRDDNFDGLKSFVVREGDEFEIDASTDTVKHKFGTKRGKILGAWATCSHKGRRPVTCFVEFDEYNAGSQVWGKYPSAMIQKVAESFALKRQFGINGLVTQEEMGDTVDIPYGMNDGTPQEQIPVAPKVDANAWLTAATELNALAESVGVTGDELRTIGERITGNRDPRKWSLTDMGRVSEYLKQPSGTEVSGDAASNQTFDLPSDENLPF